MGELTLEERGNLIVNAIYKKFVYKGKYIEE